MKLKFTDQEMAVLSAALGALPYRDVAPVIASINHQIQAQRQAESQVAPTEPASTKPSTEWAEQMAHP